MGKHDDRIVSYLYALKVYSMINNSVSYNSPTDPILDIDGSDTGKIIKELSKL